jgi:transcriptional regulator with XRE-family HTH domain
METLTPSQVVARNLREVRKQRGLSAAAVARRLGISKSKMTKLESGTQQVSIDEMFAFAFVLSVAPAVLLTPWEEWGDDSVEVVCAISPDETVVLDGPRVGDAVFDLVIGRLNPEFALFVNAREFASTAPASIRRNARNRDVFVSLQDLGWEFTESSTTSPGGLTRSEKESE